MHILSVVPTILGLCLFETVSSVDNAIINAEILSGVSRKSRKWFLTWGLLIAVLAVRGLLPWLIVWVAVPELGPSGAFLAAFFMACGFKLSAGRQESKLLGSAMPDVSKLLYLEVIDLSFSLDGVLGAFAFTLSVPIILVGNGLGAVLVRQVTVGSMERIKSYRFLKNGAMYSILALGAVMTCEAFGLRLPEWLSPLATFLIVGGFLIRSILDARAPGGGSGGRAARP